MIKQTHWSNHKSHWLSLLFAILSLLFNVSACKSPSIPEESTKNDDSFKSDESTTPEDATHTKQDETKPVKQDKPSSKTEEHTAPQTNNTNLNLPNANEADKSSEALNDPTQEKLTCTNWNNALFVDGTELYYKIKIEQFKDDLDDDEDYETDLEFYILCHIKLNYASDFHCGSSITCELEPKYNKDKYKNAIGHGLPIEGVWFIDKNGYYHLKANQFKGLIKASDVGKCATTKYIQCEPGTLAWEYTPFNQMEPLLPMTPGIKVYEASEDEDATTKKTVSRTGTVLCYHNAYEGDDVFILDICVDDTKGPSSFKEVIEGASEFMMKGSLRPKKN